jgi:serine/threonine-protein kinase
VPTDAASKTTLGINTAQKGAKGWLPKKGEQSSAHALLSDEILRTRAFLLVSGSMAALGAVASPLVDGDPTFRWALIASVVGLVVVYSACYWHFREPKNYTAVKALVVISACNYAAIASCAYYGFFSPCPMVLMLPICFFGMSQDRRVALAGYGIGAAMMAIPMGLMAVGAGADPGLIRPDALSLSERLIYTGLVQVVYGAAYVLARLMRRATDNAVEQMEEVWREVQLQGWLLQEASAELEHARAGRGAREGQVHGPWRLNERIGTGGMGEVYAAIHELDGRRAALKFLGSASRNEQSLSLFQREADLLATIHSPFVVHAFEVHLGDPAWLAMELLEGEELGDRLRRLKRLSLRETEELVNHAAEGLWAAHEAGIVHRDVKPSNLFQVKIGARRLWKLVDFGIAKLQRTESTFTQGRLLGTPGYMSPEQLRGEVLDGKSDQFALAAVAYRALVGRAPFVGRDSREILLATASSQPPAPSKYVALPPQVELILAMGLAKARSRRFLTIEAFAIAFSRACNAEISDPIRVRAEAILEKRPWGSRDI